MTNVLIIDDDAATMSIFRDTLSELDPSLFVTLVKDYESALSDLQHERIDIVLLDMMMNWGNRFKPEETSMGYLTGLRICEVIREEFPKVPVIILTALKGGHHADELSARTQELDNVKAIFNKPVSVAVVAEKIRQICREN